MPPWRHLVNAFKKRTTDLCFSHPKMAEITIIQAGRKRTKYQLLCHDDDLVSAEVDIAASAETKLLINKVDVVGRALRRHLDTRRPLDY